MKKNYSIVTHCSKCVLNLKLPLIMRIALVLLFVAVIQLRAGNGYAQKTKVPISMSQVSVEQVLNRIEETSDFVFLYNDKTIDKNRVVSVENPQGNISQILNEIFEGTPVSYTIVDKQIILSPKKVEAAQQYLSFDMKGQVRDAL